MALMRPVVASGQPASTQRYYALKLRGSAELVGVNAVTFAANDITVAVNSANDAQGPVVDFTKLASGHLAIPTGPSSADVLLDFNTRLIRASGQVVLGVAGISLDAAAVLRKPHGPIKPRLLSCRSAI